MVKKILPSLAELELVNNKIKNIPNRRGEFKRKVHYGCFLLCSQAGLRISEAVKFDLSAKNKKDLYLINKPKGKKERYVAIPREVIKELKKNNWKPHQTNRFAFYHFLKKTKRELNISPKIELTPHTFRRAFTTYHAEAGMPLPILQKLLGHSSIRTTALYWQNIYSDDNDPSDILTGKKWLERQKLSQNNQPPQPPTAEKFASPNKIIRDYLFPEQLPKNPEPPLLVEPPKKPVIFNQKPTINTNSPPPIKIEPKPTIANHQPKPVISRIPPKTLGTFSLNIISQKKEISKQLPVITNQGEQPTAQEQILLVKIQQLEEQLKQTQTENNNLKALVKSERERANNYENQLKTIAKSLYQWQKINYYQQLEKEQENQAQVEQPLLFKPN